MKLARNLAVGLILAGALGVAAPAEARHRHNSRCEHRSQYSDRHDRYDRYDRHSRHDYRYDRRHDYGGYRYDYRYGRNYDYGYGYRYRRSYPPPVRYHYHGRSRCSRGHVGIYFGF